MDNSLHTLREETKQLHGQLATHAKRRNKTASWTARYTRQEKKQNSFMDNSLHTLREETKQLHGQLATHAKRRNKTASWTTRYTR
ncbi:hypothetical protein BgiBS90_025052 [Biomphalaria glabrata]|nr:hypothetical protein BgiBS90_025052 [Biomphalaria glabrata]